MSGFNPAFVRITKSYDGNWGRAMLQNGWQMQWRSWLIPDRDKRKDNSRFHRSAELRRRSEMRKREHLTDRLRNVGTGGTSPLMPTPGTKNLVIQHLAFIPDIGFDSQRLVQILLVVRGEALPVGIRRMNGVEQSENGFFGKTVLRQYR